MLRDSDQDGLDEDEVDDMMVHEEKSDKGTKCDVTLNLDDYLLYIYKVNCTKAWWRKRVRKAAQ